MVNNFSNFVEGIPVEVAVTSVTLKNIKGQGIDGGVTNIRDLKLTILILLARPMKFF